MIKEVRKTKDFDRVAALPRRRLLQADADAWAEAMTPEFRAPGGTEILRPWQGYGIAECVENGGGWLAYPVGIGKTLIVEILARAFSAKRPMLIAPAGLKKKTYHDRGQLIKNWRLGNPPPRFTSPEELAPEAGSMLLERMRPDLIIVDESDELANPKSSAVRRLDRYIRKYRSEVSVVLMTGSPTRKSIMGYWHMLCWALDERAPVPLTQGEARMWARALDETGRMPSVRPGPLGATLAQARAWYRTRLEETPGIVIVDGDSCDQPLTIRLRTAREDSALDRYFEMFALQAYENPDVPDGLLVGDALSRWRIEGQLGCGYFQRYVAPGPPQEWRDARRNLSGFVRTAIDDSDDHDHPLDTEAQVIRRFAEHPIVQAWLIWKDVYDPRTEAVWLSNATIHTAVAWLAESAAPGIIWCGGVEFAEALSIATGLSYYGAKGQDQRGRGLHVADSKRSLIASWHANKKGFNLQAWRRAAIFHPPQSAKWREQIYGRSHRSGQDKPVVIDEFMTSGGTFDGFDAAIAEAKFARATVGLTQKILRATITRQRPTITRSNRFRWAQGDTDE